MGRIGFSLTDLLPSHEPLVHQVELGGWLCCPSHIGALRAGDGGDWWEQVLGREAGGVCTTGISNLWGE